MTTIRKLKRKQRYLELASFVASVLPLLIVFWIKRTEYVATMVQTVKLGIGGVIVVVLLILKVLGKLKVPSTVTALAMVFILAYLMEPILADLKLLTGAALVGEAIDVIFLKRQIEKVKEQIQTERTSSATADKVADVMKTYLGGRV